MQACIRAFTPRDYPAIADVYNAAWQGHSITGEQLRIEDEAMNLASLAMNEHFGFVKWRTWIVFAKTFPSYKV